MDFNGVVEKLHHYPIKGLSAQPLETVSLAAGEGFPFDRVFGFARHDSGFDSAYPMPLPKDRFFVLLRDEKLAKLKTRFDPETRHLSIEVDGETVFDDNLSTTTGIEAALTFLSDMFELPPEKRPVFAHAAPHRFTDVSVVSKEMMNAVSLINLASVRELGDRIGTEVDPLRFRGNIYFDGWAPGSELELVGREIAIGEARLKVVKRTRRCAATEVNPQTAERDIRILHQLKQHYGHLDMGVYAEVLSPGRIAPGDRIST